MSGAFQSVLKSYWRKPGCCNMGIQKIGWTGLEDDEVKKKELAGSP
jgi:hypothetical protein